MSKHRKMLTALAVSCVVLLGAGFSLAEPFISSADYSTFSDAVAAASGKTLVIARPETLDQSATVPSDVHLMFFKGGKIEKASTYTLTINGPVTAPYIQIFSSFSPGEVTFSPQSVEEVYPQWWGTEGSDDSAAIQCAIDSGCSHVHLPRGGYGLYSALNLTNRGNKRLIFSGDGYSEGKVGTWFDLYAGIALDCIGSGNLTLRDFSIYSESGLPYVGILYGPSTVHQSVGSNNLVNVLIQMSNPSANDSNGVAAVYNCGAGQFYARHLYITTDNAMVLTGDNIFNVSSPYATIQTTGEPLSNVTIDGTSTLRSWEGASIIIDNATQIKIPNAYLSGKGEAVNPFGYITKITGTKPCSEIFITGHKERHGGYVYVDNVPVQGLYLEGTGIDIEFIYPLVTVAGENGSITDGKIAICHMEYPNSYHGDPPPPDSIVIEALGSGGGIRNLTIQLYDYQIINVPTRDFSGNIILADQPIADAYQSITVDPNASYVLVATNGVEIVGITEMVTSCQSAINAGYGLAADLNKDCHVNLQDIALLAIDWLKCNNPEDSNCVSPF